MHETSSFEFSRPFNPDKEATLLNSNTRKFVFSNSRQTHKTVQMNCIKTGLMFAKAWRDAPKSYFHWTRQIKYSVFFNCAAVILSVKLEICRKRKLHMVKLSTTSFI